MKKMICLALTAVMLMTILPAAFAAGFVPSPFTSSVEQETDLFLIEAKGILLVDEEEIPFENVAELRKLGYDIHILTEYADDDQGAIFKEFVKTLKVTPVSELDYADGGEGLKALTEELGVTAEQLSAVMPMDVRITPKDDEDVLIPCKELAFEFVISDQLNPVGALHYADQKMNVVKASLKAEDQLVIVADKTTVTVSDGVTGPYAFLIVNKQA